MKNYLLGVMKDKKIRMRFLVLIILLIYIPIFLNIFIIYKSTISTIKKERVEALDQVLYKATQSIDYNLNSIEKVVVEIANDNPSNASLYSYKESEEKFQKRMDEFLKERLTQSKNKNHLIDQLTYVSYTGDFFSSEEKYQFNENKFIDSKIYKEFLKSDEELLWDYNNGKRDFIEGDNEVIIILHKLSYEIPNIIMKRKNILEKDRIAQVGVLVTILDVNTINSLYKDIPINDIQDISIYNNEGKVLFKDKENSNLSNEVKNMIDDDRDIDTKEIYYNNEDFLLSVSKIKTIDGWYLSTIQSLDTVIGETKSSLLSSFLILGVVGLVIALWIILELLFFSKLITEKEMSSYRLEIMEDMNGKLRMYKHDFFNHLQIIQGLLEMGQSDRAKKYLTDVVKEGRTITSRYEIGIPEIEATIYSAINRAKKSGIDVEVSSIELSEDICINLYDLSKILSNLLKNAIQALEKVKDDHKLLKIDIYESLGEYVFSIYNNTPIISEDIRDDIFIKGYSTNGSKDRGLGLHIVQKLIEKNGGNIELIIDDGNYFIVRFPVK